MAGPDKDLLSKADSLLTLPADQLQDKVDKYHRASCERIHKDAENQVDAQTKPRSQFGRGFMFRREACQLAVFSGKLLGL